MTYKLCQNFKNTYRFHILKYGRAQNTQQILKHTKINDKIESEFWTLDFRRVTPHHPQSQSSMMFKDPFGCQNPDYSLRLLINHKLIIDATCNNVQKFFRLLKFRIYPVITKSEAISVNK